MVQPSALNVLIIGASVIIFAFFWRMLAGRLVQSENGTADALGEAMATIL